MRPVRPWGLLVAFAALGQGPLAQGGPLPGELLPRSSLSAKVGEWVTWRLDGGGGRASYWRMAVIGQERDKKGREALWIEMEIGEHPELVAPMAQMRMLVARETGMSGDGVSRWVVAQGFERPREVSPEALAAFLSGSPAGETASGPRAAPFRIRTGARGWLKTLAGRVTAQPVELLLGGKVIRRLWMSPAVPLLGLARLEVPALGQVMEVVAYGADARPHMVLPAPETPQIPLERYNAARNEDATQRP